MVMCLDIIRGWVSPPNDEAGVSPPNDEVGEAGFERAAPLPREKNNSVI